jgi:hypothetical protein
MKKNLFEFFEFWILNFIKVMEEKEEMEQEVNLDLMLLNFQEDKMEEREVRN